MLRRNGIVGPYAPGRAAIAALALGGTALVAAWLSRPGPRPAPGTDRVPIVSAPNDADGATASPLPASGIGIALHAVGSADDPAAATATLSHDGQPPRILRLGDIVTPGVLLAAIAADHVDLSENGATTRLYLLASPRPGSPRQGLDPEPTAPSGELPARELIARMQAAGAASAVRTPEEIAAGR